MANNGSERRFRKAHTVKNYRNTPLVALGPNYVFPVRWSTEGPSHGVLGKASRRTSCGMDFGEEPFDFVNGPIDCEPCLDRLRERGVSLS